MSQQPYYPPPPQMGMPAPQAARNGLGIAALILGIIGAVFGLIPLFFWLAGILGLLALIFGLVGMGRAKRGQATNKGVAITGTILGAISLILAVVGLIIFLTAAKKVVDEIDKLDSKARTNSVSAGASGSDSDSGSDSSSDSGKKDPSAETYGPGDTASYDSGIEVTVSKATPYTPDEFAAGHQKGNKAYKVTVQVQNKGKDKFKADMVLVEAKAGAAGTTAERIFDGKMLGTFTGSILPGKAATVEMAFDAPADAKVLDVEVTPSLDHEGIQWNLPL
ncbi:DUF4190 domain-containing protein [Streptomyces sp. NPDC003077]|uniref:DUF4190 domain-containing protein n=1 Tax=Streptomyces sp. NPDC003077 TaxID=3154443 RepID=UPI0033B14359